MSTAIGRPVAQHAPAQAKWTAAQRERELRIRRAAYFRAENRDFLPGHELEDWLAAEEEVDRLSRPLPGH